MWEDTALFYTDICEAGLRQPAVSLGLRTPDGQLVGLALNAVYEYDELGRAAPDPAQREFGPCLDRDRTYPARNGNRLNQFIEFVEAGLFKQLSPWAKLFKLDILAVRADFCRPVFYSKTHSHFN